jgi:hypothetical protein
MNSTAPRAAACLLAGVTAVAIGATSAGQERSAAPSPVRSTCNYSPVASSLDKSMEFYRTVAGLEFGNVSTMGPAQKVFLDIHGIAVQRSFPSGPAAAAAPRRRWHSCGI